jgi:ribonuclease P protein component
MLTKKVKIFDRLKSANDIEMVYKNGNVIISTDRKIKASYLYSEITTNRIKIAVTISSKTGSSVWRNRFKRVVREALRFEMDILKEIMLKKKSDLSIIFSQYRINQINHKQLFLKDIHPAVTDILNKLSKTTTRN